MASKDIECKGKPSYSGVNEGGRHLAETVLKVLEGRTSSYTIRDPEKLMRVAHRLGMDTSEGKEDSARSIVAEALSDYAFPTKDPLRFTIPNLTLRRRGVLESYGLIPYNNDRRVADVKSRASQGFSTDPIPLVFGLVARAIVGYDGMQLSSDLSDILFGTPHLVRTYIDLTTIKADAVNIAVHSQSPISSEVMADVAKRLEPEARMAGASGIDVIATCCTQNETLVHRGTSLAIDSASQELVLATGMVDLLVADHRCIMPSTLEICRCMDTQIVTTEKDVHNPYCVHVKFHKEDVEGSARSIIRMAIEAFKRRIPNKRSVSNVRSEMIVGFSLEQIEDLLATMSPEDPWMHLKHKLREGKVRGIALMTGCCHQGAEEGGNHLTIAKELLKNDVLVLSTGCSTSAFALNGLLSSEATIQYAGPSLKEFLQELSRANNVPLPPIWHMGSCVDNTRAMNLVTELANHFGVDADAIPFVVCSPEANHENAVTTETWCVAFGLPVQKGTIDIGSAQVAEVLTNTAQDVFGGRFIYWPSPELTARFMLNEIERRRWKLKLDHRHQVAKGASITTPQLYSMAIDGAIIATGFADQLLSTAIGRYGYEQRVEFPETGYALPAIAAWQGKEIHRLADIPEALGQARSLIRPEATYENALAAGEAVMVAAEVIEVLKYIPTERPYEGTGYCGFIPDKVLRELGVAFVDDTIPGCAVLVGTAEDPKALAKVVRDCQSKGMLIIASFNTIRQLQDEGVKVGLDVRLYPVGEFTQVIHGLNFAIRAALTFGNVQKGDRERLQKYLQKRPKVFVLQLGPIDSIKAAAEFAVLLNGSPTITDQQVEPIPERFVSQPIYGKMVQTAIELRGIQVRLAHVDIPVAYGPAFEGETVRRPDTYVEAGGASKTLAFELLRMLPEEQVEDGKITLIGRDVDEMPEGGRTPLAIIVDVYGKKMQEDFETVLERRIHQFINFAEGAWHTGQRNTIWIRLSRPSVRAGLRFKHFGDILVTKIKAEFGNIVSRVQVTIITDESEANQLLPLAKEKYRLRDERMADLTDEAVDTVFSCQLCQSFAPDHICIITPERLGLCGAINWLDAKAAKEIAPTGPNQPIRKGETVDVEKGQWAGVNQAVLELSHGKLERFNAYTMMEHPMTSCGCFEVIVAMTADAQAVVLVNREFAGMTPVGMKFSTLAGGIGGGKQTPGFIGVGRKYILSKKFISADGGFLRIAWMPKELKTQMYEGLSKRAGELGVPGFVEKIADETITETAEGLMEWMAKVDHPALRMPPLLQ